MSNRENMVEVIENILKDRRQYKADLEAGLITQEQHDRMMAERIADNMYGWSYSYGSMGSINYGVVAAALKPELDFAVKIIDNVLLPKATKGTVGFITSIKTIVLNLISNLETTDSAQLSKTLSKMMETISEHSNHQVEFSVAMGNIAKHKLYARTIAFSYVQTLLIMVQLSSSVINEIVKAITSKA